MQNPRNLDVTEHAYRLAIDVYRLTSAYPPEERFGLTQQMRRSAVSIGSNITEGCGRRGDRDLLKSLYIALAEAKELAFQLRIGNGLDFGNAAKRLEVSDAVDRMERMLNRLTTYLRATPPRGTRKGARSAERPRKLDLNAFASNRTNPPTHQPTNSVTRP